jgi:K(+)-stimulated pyrophosphate-energized sodium pump
MRTENDDGSQTRWPVLAGVAVLLAGLVIGLTGADFGRHAKAAQHLPLTPALPVPAAAASEGAATEVEVRQDEGVIRFYFDRESIALTPEASEALGAVVKGVAAGQKAVISGFDGADGDPAQNEELTRQRVQAVRGTLFALGIGDDKMTLTAPQPAARSAGAARVEVRLE